MRVGAVFCPGILHAVPAKDGLLLRIRVPGGLLRAEQLRRIATLAGEFADGWLEITSRANVQLRGVGADDLGGVVEGLTSVGLLPSAKHDRVRNLVTSPLAGADATELMDPRPLLLELDRRLRLDDALAALHPKFGFGVYGGSRRFSRERDDVGLSAVRVGEMALLELSLAGDAVGCAVLPEDAVDVMLCAANTCLELAAAFGVSARMKRVLGVAGGLERMKDALQQWLRPFAGQGLGAAVDAVPYGVRATSEGERVSVVPCVPLGRMTAAQAEGVAEIVDGCGGDLRLASWRGFVVASVPVRGVEGVVRKLDGLGLLLDGADGFQGIAACAGSEGCDAALADVRGDAVRLAGVLAGGAVMQDWTVNVSGCEKQCARRQGASADLIATEAGYNLIVGGQVVEQDCSSAEAIDTVAALHRNLSAEVVAR
ncbi:MAG: precorrin-3B synthase [Acidobacteria bacterium]|nr:precorrin-3B synthase [Acidobacteriota bacterium]